MNDEELIWEAYSKILNEAIPLSLAKRAFTRKEYPRNYVDRLNNAFENKDRVILPFNNKDFSNWSDSDLIVKINDVLQANGYNRLTAKDFLKGYAHKKDDKQIYKIGRILQSLNEFDLLERYKKNETRQLSNQEYVVVISRHPYDIAGASTDRNWTTCLDNQYPRIVYKNKKSKDAFGKETSSDYYSDLQITDPKFAERQSFKTNEDPELISYLVPKNEIIPTSGKIKLNKPIARLLIQGTEENEFYLEGYCGVRSKEFEKIVVEWLKSKSLLVEDELEDDYY
jgi:hypothetical protein